jgi:NADH-quinone oxidoreductase subunit L
MVAMLALIPLLPLLGFLVNVAVGPRLSKAVSGSVACVAMFAAFGVALSSVVSLVRLPADARIVEQVVFTWLPSGDFQLPLALRLDPLAAVMVLVVTGIGFLIHVYSVAYMHDENDAEYARYFSYLNLFAAFMLLLVLGSNFVILFVGWEGVGLCSYLLIGYWYEKKSAADAGKKAFIVNRVGDFGFLLGMLLVFVTFGTLDFLEVADAVAPMSPETTFGVLSAITLLLFVGATGKSAQIPLFTWLPDAMEGPTPVSALIHAATMVTAGVYMIGRNAVLFSHAPNVLAIIAAVGVATAIMAATIGLVQRDIKRVLAYSTVSQLGLMFLAMGVGAYAAGIFHLYTHAFFKALLFLGAGAVIHSLAGEQDLFRMGGLKRELPVSYWTFLIGALAISGVPGLAGFFSKDEIFYRTFAGGHYLLWTVGIITSLLTATYMFRAVFLAFHGPKPRPEEMPPPAHPEEEEPVAMHHLHPHPDEVTVKGPHPDPHRAASVPAHLHDAPPAMAIVLILLAVGSVVAGYIGVPAALGGGNRIEHFLEPSFHAPNAPHAEAHAEEHHLATELALMGVSAGVAVAGVGLAVFFFLRRRDAAEAMSRRFSGIYRVLLGKYFVDELYDAVFVRPVKRVSEQTMWRRVDAGLIDAAVNGAGEVVTAASGVMKRIQTGSVRVYAASVFLGVLVVLGYYLWR